jgi:ACS family tartrate transporter-like MFS transporter
MPTLDPSSESALMTKVTRKLIPFMFVLYIVAYLDRVNVSFAKLQMQDALGFSEAVYGLGAGIFFIGYFLLEIPSNLIMEKVGARVWIARIMITWGLLAAAMMFVRTPAQFYWLRFALGLAEAGFFPGMILYLTYWFPAAERARAVGRFMTATAVANIIGSPVSGALLKLHGFAGLEGWQWLFLLEGLPSCLLGLAVLFYLPNGPKDARWLSAEEKVWIEKRLAPEQADASHKHNTLGQALMSPAVWLLCLVYFMQATGSYGFSFWLPSVIKANYTKDEFQIGLLTAIPFIAATLGLVFIAARSDRMGERRLHITGASWWGALWVGVAGLLLLGQGPLATGLALVALILAPFGMSGTLGPFWAMSSSLLSGTAAAGGIAFINSVGNLGGFVGGYALGWLKDRSPGFTSGLLFVAGAYFLLGLFTLFVRVHPEHSPSVAASGAEEPVPEYFTR